MFTEMKEDRDRLMAKAREHYEIADRLAAILPEKALIHMQLAKEFWTLANALKQETV